MSNLPALIPASTVEHFGGRERLDLIRETIATGTSDAEFALFLAWCERQGLDPFARQAYAIVRNDRRSPTGKRMTIQTSIDGYRCIADKQPNYAGSTRPVFEYDEHGRLDAAVVTVHKLIGDRLVPFEGVAYWSEFYPGDDQPGQWKKMPRLMLAKCAEAQALRKAFPSQLSGAYTHEEMAQADHDADPWRARRDELIARARQLPEHHRAKLRAVGDPRVMGPEELLGFETELAFCETAAQAEQDEQVVDAELVDDGAPYPPDDHNDDPAVARQAAYLTDRAMTAAARYPEARARRDGQFKGAGNMGTVPAEPVGADA